MSEEVKQVVIIGSGCAGHTAAIYAARANLAPLVFEGEEPGGQLTLTTIVENFPGFPNGVDGFELVNSMKKQAMNFGAEYIMDNVETVDLSSRPFHLTTKQGKSYQAKTLIIASGARARLLNVPGEQEFFSKGIHTCATCDGAFYRDKKIAVIGGGDTAMEDSLFLTRFASELHLIHRRDKLRASQIMQERVMKNPKITVHWNSQLVEAYGENDRLKGLKLKVTENGNERIEDFDCEGVFLAIGHIPNIEFLKNQLETNSEGYIVTKRDPEQCITCDVWTSVPGVFAAGDVVDWHFQQAITAAAMGCKAAMAAEEFLGEEEE